ncbi:MAG: glutaredoxin domain-containing protein [Pseudomonadota bacterium]
MEVSVRLQQLLDRYPVCVFMRGCPEQPSCRESLEAIETLTDAGVSFHSVDIQRDPELRALLQKSPDYSELPQVFLNGQCLGGATLLRELHVQGELVPMVEQLDVQYQLTG